MRRVTLVHLIYCLAMALPAGAWAQTAPPPPAGGTQPPAGTQAKPAATTPAAAAQPAVEAVPSLFDEAARQIEFGGRVSSIDGDPARFQRYEDIRDGFLIRD